MGARAAAQSQRPVREEQRRQVLVPSTPGAPVPEVRVAVHVTSYLRFDASLERSSLEVEGRATRFRFLDVGERFVAFEPLVEPGPEERLVLRVRYKDGGQVVLALVSHPSLVDKEVEVVHQPRPSEPPEVTLVEKEAELTVLKARCAAGGPAGLVASGLLDRSGIQIQVFEGSVPPGNRSGLTLGKGTSYQASLWAVVAVQLTNTGEKPWAPGSARLFSAEGTPVRVRLVQLNGLQLQPGESGLVVVETDVPTSGTAPFRLELLDTEGGRLLPIHKVKFRRTDP
jgi:uncharacterized protein (TIGR02268 family)